MNRLDIKLKDHKHPSDVTLVVKDGKEFRAHRSMLSQASSFFEKLFNSDMKENNEGVIRLEIVSESQMGDILEFIYTGGIEISTQENAEDLLELGDYLLLPDLKAIAEKYLKEHVNTFNCLPFYYMAEKYSVQDLMNICQNFIHSNFSSVVESDDFIKLSSKEVEKWISSDEIAIDAEENVFELILQWIDHDKSQRRVKFRDLFRHVRLTCISRHVLASKVVTNDLVKEDEDCIESVFLALQWLDRSADCDIPRLHPPRRSRKRDVIVITVCGQRRRLLHTHLYLPSTEQWYRLPLTSCEPAHVFSYQGKVFLIAKHFARSQCYDPDLNCWAPAPWTNLDSELAIMKLQNTYIEILDVLVVKDQICFIVQEGTYSPPTLWRFDVDLNSMIPLFHWVKKQSFCSVVVGRLIYAIGGKSLDILSLNSILSDCSTFDTERQEWKAIAPLKEARRSACGVCKNEEKIFVAGGRGSSFRDAYLDSCEVYNIATNEWQLIASLTMPRIGGKMVLIDGTIYVLEGSVKFVDGNVPIECYDEERDNWTERTTMCSEYIFLTNPIFPDCSFFLKVCQIRLFNYWLSSLVWRDSCNSS